MSNYAQDDQSRQQRGPPDPFAGGLYTSNAYEESADGDEYDRNRDTYTSEEGSEAAAGRERGECWSVRRCDVMSRRGAQSWWTCS
jgi:hypothetical protein